MHSAIALFASSRRYGNTGRLMDRIAADLGIAVVDLAVMNISAFDYQHRNRDDDFEPLMERVLQANSIIFASPVYWYAASPPIKIFLDRISDYLDLPDLLEKGRQLRGKTGYVVCTSVYADASVTFINAFRETFGYLGMHFGGCMHANCANGYIESAYQKDIADFVKRLKTQHPDFSS